MSYLLLSCSFCLFVVTFCWCLIGFRLWLSVCRLLLFTGDRLLARNGYLRSLVAISVANLLLPSLLLLNHYYCHPWLLCCYVAMLLCCYVAISCIARCGSRLVVSQSILSTPIHSFHAISFSPRQFVVACVGSSSNFAKWLPDRLTVSY